MKLLPTLTLATALAFGYANAQTNNHSQGSLQQSLSQIAVASKDSIARDALLNLDNLDYFKDVVNRYMKDHTRLSYKINLPTGESYDPFASALIYGDTTDYDLWIEFGASRPNLPIEVEKVAIRDLKVTIREDKSRQINRYLIDNPGRRHDIRDIVERELTIQLYAPDKKNKENFSVWRVVSGSRLVNIGSNFRYDWDLMNEICECPNRSDAGSRPQNYFVLTDLALTGSRLVLNFDLDGYSNTTTIPHEKIPSAYMSFAKQIVNPLVEVLGAFPSINTHKRK